MVEIVPRQVRHVDAWRVEAVINPFAAAGGHNLDQIEARPAARVEMRNRRASWPLGLMAIAP